MQASQSSKISPKLALVSRYLLGLIFFVFGLAGLFNLIPPPADMPEAQKTFMAGLMAAKYFFPLLKLTEVATGAMLLFNFMPALALIVLAPISINIFFTHLFVTPGIQNLVLPLVIIIVHVLSATAYWSTYKPLFSKNK